jgi:aspartate carbamoyltransferase catalytic subunit
VLPTVDVCYLHRACGSSASPGLVPSLREYTTCFGLSAARAAPARHAIVMRGAMNRGVEIAADVARPASGGHHLQVRNGVA